MQHYRWNPYSSHNHIVPVRRINNLFSSAPASNDGNDSSSSCGPVNSSANTTPPTSPDKQHEAHHRQSFIRAPPPYLALPSSATQVRGSPQPTTTAPSVHSGSSAVTAASPDPEYALHNIQSLRSLGSDAQIEAQVPALSPMEHCSMLDAILRGHSNDKGARPDLFLGLCTKDRGNVVSQLLKTLSPSSKHQKRHHQQQAPCADVYFQATIQLLENHWTELCSGQYGSIAVSRLFTALPSVPYKQYVAQLALRDWAALSQHQYGNFVMKEILQVAGQNVAEFDFVFAHLSADLALPLTFSRLAECKFAGHVVETVMSHAPTRYIQRICTPLFTTSSGIQICVRLSHHKQGNYPLQAVFKAVSTCNCDPRESLVPVLCNVIWPRLERSPYRRNLFKAVLRPMGAPPAFSTAEAYPFPSSARSSTNTTSPSTPRGTSVSPFPSHPVPHMRRFGY